MVTRDLAFSEDFGDHRSVVATELDFGFGNLDGGVGSDFQVNGLPWEDGGVDSVDSLGNQVVGVRVVIGAGVVANPGLVGLAMLHGVGEHRMPFDVGLVGCAGVVVFEGDFGVLG